MAFTSSVLKCSEEAFNSAWKAGQVMTLEQAVEYALSDKQNLREYTP